MLCIRKMSGSDLGPKLGYHDRLSMDFLTLSRKIPGYMASLNLATDAAFHMFSNSLFIRRYTDSAKPQMNK